MRNGYVRGFLLRLAVFLVILLGFRLCGFRDEARFWNEQERKSALFAQKAFLLEMLEGMERGGERDWLGEVYDSTSQTVEVYGRGEEMYVYRLTYYWD